MSANPEPSPGAAASWPVLESHERRVLGVLVEKAKTTPDAYPLSLNSLVTGCNQKSNRDPVLNLSDAEVEEALLALQKKGLVVRLTGSGRVERWRHVAYETWKVDKVELAVLAELLLRGPQTEGELRGRASRMEPIDDLDRLRAVLKPLVERHLVIYLTPEGRRGTALTHGFHDPRELERLRAMHKGAADTPAVEVPAARPAAPDWQARLDHADAEIAALKGTVAGLEHKLAALAEELCTLKASLGA
jgi:uncharacterized protein YceH (UPF0502 family)